MANLSLAGIKGLNPVLTQYMQDYIPPDAVCDKLFPVINLQKTKGQIPQAVQREYMRTPSTKRGNLTPATTANKTYTLADYEMFKYSLAYDYSKDDLDEGKALGGVFSDMPLMYTKMLRNQMQLDREKRCYAEVIAEATAGSLSGNQWNSGSGVTIRADIYQNRDFIRLGKAASTLGIGKFPNLMIMSRTVADVALNDSTFIAYLDKQTNVAILDETTRINVFSKWTGIPNVIIAEMPEMQVVEGQSDSVAVDIWSDTVVLAYVEALGAFTGFGHGYTFRKNQYVREFELLKEEGYRVELNMFETFEIIKPEAIVAIQNVLG
jgi:hypothetical protein